ncbi:MAG: VOC family protein [Spirochaeta sp.]
MKILRANTILYCRRWSETVGFYADGIGLPILMQKEWFVEFSLGNGTALSVADQARTSIDSAQGNGITISLRVEDAAGTRSSLLKAGLNPGQMRQSWGRDAFFIRDPEGNRLEFWS